MEHVLLTDRASTRGGAERWIGELVDATRARGERWHLVSGHADETGGAFERRCASRRRLRGLGVGVPDRRERATLAGLDGILEAPSLSSVVVQNVLSPALLERLADDPRALIVVHDHRLFCPAGGKTLPDGTPCAVRVGRDACEACFEGTDTAEGARLRDLRVDLVRARLAALRRFRRVVVVSQAMRDFLVAEEIDADRVAIVPPVVSAWALDGPPAAAAACREGVALVGRIAPTKGTFDFVEAWARCGAPAPLHILGDGPQREHLERLAADRGVALQVTGWMGDGALREALVRHRVVVLPSRWAEPFGLVGLEAGAVGLPVVAPRTGGIPEWLEHGATGVLVPPGDPKALARAASALHAEPERCDALGAAARRHVRERFGREQFVRAWSRAREGA